MFGIFVDESIQKRAEASDEVDDGQEEQTDARPSTSQQDENTPDAAPRNDSEVVTSC